MAWFRREHAPLPPNEAESRVPEGLWVKCTACKEIIYRKDVLENQSVCPKCAFHFRISRRASGWSCCSTAPGRSSTARWSAPTR